MFDSSLQFSAKLFLVFFNKSLQKQAYPHRPYLFVYFVNRTVAFFSAVCNLYSASFSHVISFPTSIYCMNCFAVSFLKLLLRVSKKIICVIWRNFTEWHTTFSSLQNMESMLLSFRIRRSYNSCNLAAAKSKESFGSTNQRPGAPISNQQPIKRLEPRFQGN